MKYNDSLVKYNANSKGPHSKLTFDDFTLSVLDGYDKYNVEDFVMFKITKRFELATQMVIQNKFSSSDYQVRYMHIAVQYIVHGLKSKRVQFMQAVLFASKAKINIFYKKKSNRAAQREPSLPAREGKTSGEVDFCIYYLKQL